MNISISNVSCHFLFENLMCLKTAKWQLSLITKNIKIERGALYMIAMKKFKRKQLLKMVE